MKTIPKFKNTRLVYTIHRKFHAAVSRSRISTRKKVPIRYQTPQQQHLGHNAHRNRYRARDGTAWHGTAWYCMYSHARALRKTTESKHIRAINKKKCSQSRTSVMVVMIDPCTMSSREMTWAGDKTKTHSSEATEEKKTATQGHKRRWHSYT